MDTGLPWCSEVYTHILRYYQNTDVPRVYMDITDPVSIFMYLYGRVHRYDLYSTYHLFSISSKFSINDLYNVYDLFSRYGLYSGYDLCR